ncbi:MAG: hypothetical protein M1836_000497 [Candelina mexicana]|nr:MAG: hypothetical protein M1836_000497 [Candelina mexicana]
MRLPSIEILESDLMAMSHRPSSSAPFPNIGGLTKVIRHTLRSPTITLRQSEAHTAILQRLHILRLSDGHKLHLKLTPASTTRLQRHERFLLEAEAQVLLLLGPQPGLSVPQLYGHDSSSRAIGCPYVLTGPVSGMSLLQMRPYLTPNERNHVDKQIGIMINTISQQASAAFGHVTQVSSGAGRRSWREVFLSLIESVLRDAEDMLICLPDEQIREHIERLAPYLDEITQPRLVVLNAGDASNVVVDPHTKKITGLMDYSRALWGDYLMVDAFADASPAFYEGFGYWPVRFGAEKKRQLM